MIHFGHESGAPCADAFGVGCFEGREDAGRIGAANRRRCLGSAAAAASILCPGPASGPQGPQPQPRKALCERRASLDPPRAVAERLSRSRFFVKVVASQTGGPGQGRRTSDTEDNNRAAPSVAAPIGSSRTLEAASRMLRDLLAFEGIKTGRLHVATLMKRMAIEAIYRKPNTSKPAPGHKIYPYLLCPRTDNSGAARLSGA